MHANEPGWGGAEGSTHMFNKELCQSVLLLDTFFQFSQEKTKRRRGDKRRKPHSSELCCASGMRSVTEVSPNPAPKVRCRGRMGPGFPGGPDSQDHKALTLYASHKSGEYFQTRSCPFLACPQGRPFLLFSS